MMRKASPEWTIAPVLEKLGRSLTRMRSLDDTARADEGTVRNTRETHLNKDTGVPRSEHDVLWYWYWYENSPRARQ